MMVEQGLWEPLLAAIRARINRQNFDIWFTQIRCLGIEDQEVRLEVPSRYFHDWIQDNYQELILTELERLSGQSHRLSFSYPVEGGSTASTPRETAAVDVELEVKSPEESFSPTQFSLNPDKTFETFVVGSSNQFAHAAARAVADRPAQTYNPLFIFGTVGLGKTHLLNAIGNKMLEANPTARIIYLSSEQFVNDLITSIRFERMMEFRNKYRESCDALLVDDIQFLAGKVRTQEEFFYTFNALHSSGRQIVVTSDKFPKEIQGMEERLRNRFEWGLIADIQPPDLETKVAILQKKAAFDHIHLPDDVAHYIASNTKSNIRELEGILIRLGAASSFYKRAIDLPFTQQVLRQLLTNGQSQVTIDGILDAVSRHYDIKLVELKSHRKHRQLVWPRQVAMYLCRQYTSGSFPEIGQRFGGRDHTTVIHAVKKVEEVLKRDLSISDEIKAVERLLGV